MEFAHEFIPTSSTVGLLPMVTYFFITVAAYSFLANLIFALTTRTGVAPEHRTSRVLTAVIAAVAGVSYLLITVFFHHYLEQLATTADPADRDTLTRHAYNAIGQYRYMDWAITTPLLLLKMTSMLRVRSGEAASALTVLLIADFLMILTGYIGEQQLTAAGEIMVAPKLIWGAISTIGYVVVVVIMYRLWKQFSERAEAEERWGYKMMAYTVVTFWGVYPIGYILTCFQVVDLNWIQLSFSVADIINKVGVGVIAYIAAKQVVEKRVADDATAPAYTLS
jgi:sensory rhodopsin